MRSTLPLLLAFTTTVVSAQTPALPPLPGPIGIPRPGPVTEAPYSPQPILPGGVVVPLYAPGSPFLNASRVREAEVYNVSQTVPGRINSIVNIHHPSIEFHPVDRYLNTGAAVILVAGGGHNSLNVGSEARTSSPSSISYGVNTVILRNRLRRDGYNAEPMRCTTRNRRSASCAPTRKNGTSTRIGSASSASRRARSWRRRRRSRSRSSTGRPRANDPFAGVSSRPDFVGIIYPGPTPFSVRNPTGPSTSAARNPSPPPIPRNAPPAFMATAGSGDRIHALWAMDYAYAMLDAGVPNVEIHVYGNGRHPGDSLPDGGRMTGGLSAANSRPMSTWPSRFIEWFRDLGFLQKPGVETKAARDVAAFVDQSH